MLEITHYFNSFVSITEIIHLFQFHCSGYSDFVDEISVVGDDDHGDVLFEEEAFEVFTQEDVEVVCGFVQEEEAWVVGEEDGDFQAALLTEAEVFDGGFHELFGEEIFGQDAAARGVL